MANSRQFNNCFKLHEAIESRDKVTAQTLIYNGVDLNTSNEDGNTPLHLSITEFNDLDIIKMLLDKGADIHAKNDDNYTPLNIAIRYNRLEAASLLMKKGALVEKNFNSSLIEAINKWNYEIVKLLIDYGVQNNLSFDLKTLNSAICQANLKIIELIMPHCQYLKPSEKYIPRELVMKSIPRHIENINELLKRNFTLHPDCLHDEDFIYRVAQKGHLQILLQLLKHTIDVNMVHSKTGLNLLTIACLNKHHEIVEQLLKHGANVDVTMPGKNKKLKNHRYFRYYKYIFKELVILHHHETDSSDVTFLHIAVINYDPKMIEILLRFGAKVTDYADFFNLTCVAAKNGCTEIVRMFLDHGIDVTDIDSQKRTLLHFCIFFEQCNQDTSYNVAKLLLERGANIFLQTPGNTFFFDAVTNGHYKISQLFLDYNADIQYISPDGNTPLHNAIKKHFDVKFIKTLLKLNFTVDAVNNQGLTPLFIACDKGMEAATKCLLDNHANLHATNNKGQTPLHVCYQSAYYVGPTLIQLLLKHNANIEAVDKNGWTPLFTACNDSNFELVKCLLDNHANINHTDLEKQTVLHIVVKESFLDSCSIYQPSQMIKLLVKYGANIDVLDGRSRTPLQNAVQRMIGFSDLNLEHITYFCQEYQKIIKILVSQGIKLTTAGLRINNHNLDIVSNINPHYYITIDNVKYSAIDVLQLNVASDFNDDIISDIRYSDESEIGQLKVKCEQEIQKMKNERINIDNITFYDLLKKNIRFLYRILENEKIQQSLESEIYDEKFPLYIDIIKNRLRKAKIQYTRYRLINCARECFGLNINQRLPDECIDLVLNYLSLEDLIIFISAMRLSNA